MIFEACRCAWEGCIRSVRDAVQALLVLGATALSQQRTVREFVVINLSDRADGDGVFQRLAQVLDLIERFDPGRLRRMRRYCKRIYIVPGGASEGSYWRSTNACALHVNHILSDSVLSVAMTIVHEAMHARIELAGIRYVSGRRMRIENACVRQELEFAELVPESGPEMQEARMALARVCAGNSTGTI